MNNSTNTGNSQGLDPNEAAASLSLATHLMMPQGQNGSQTPETSGQAQEQTQTSGQSPQPGQSQGQTQEDPMKNMESMFSQKLDEMRKELKDDNQREIDELKKTIQSALADDNEPS